MAQTYRSGALALQLSLSVNEESGLLCNRAVYHVMHAFISQPERVPLMNLVFVVFQNRDSKLFCEGPV